MFIDYRRQIKISSLRSEMVKSLEILLKLHSAPKGANSIFQQLMSINISSLRDSLL